jgi:organic radical activating enzyme
VQSAGYVSEIFVSFQGEGLHAGRRQLFLRMGGCHLRCRYCDTPGSLERAPQYRAFGNGTALEHANPVEPERLAASIQDVLSAAGPVDGTAITGGEPLLQAEFLQDLLANFPQLPRPVLLETSGTLPERLRLLIPQIDIVSMDIKIPSNTAERPFWEEHHRFLELAGAKAYVKVLVDSETNPDEVEVAARLVARQAVETPFFLQPIAAASGEVRIDHPTIDRFFHRARLHLADVRVLPQTHKMLGIR